LDRDEGREQTLDHGLVGLAGVGFVPAPAHRFLGQDIADVVAFVLAHRGAGLGRAQRTTEACEAFAQGADRGQRAVVDQGSGEVADDQGDALETMGGHGCEPSLPSSQRAMFTAASSVHP